MTALHIIEVLGIILGCLVSLGTVARAIGKAGHHVADVAERKIEDTAAQVAAAVSDAVVQDLGRVDRRVARLEHRVTRLEEHLV